MSDLPAPIAGWATPLWHAPSTTGFADGPPPRSGEDL